MNWNDVKNLDLKELEGMIPERFGFKDPPLWKHQLVCLLSTIACIEKHKTGFLNCLDMGTGKTRIAIDYARYLYHISGAKDIKILVVALNSAVENWADEANKFSDFIPYILRGDRKNKITILRKNKSGFYIISYEGLRALLTEKKSESEISVYSKKKTKISNNVISDLFKNKFDLFIIDESHKIKSKDSQNFKIANQLSKFIPKRLLLTGTPFGNNLLDIWAQYYIIDFGKTFFPSINQYKITYFKNEKKYFYGGVIPNWVIKDGTENIIKEKFFERAIRYTEDEVGELPEKVYRTINYNMSSDQFDAYGLAIENLVEDTSGGGLNIADKAMVFRQICSGFIKRTDKIFDSNPKLKALEDLIDQVVDNHKLVVFHEFIQEGLFIESLLKKKKIKYNKLNGSVKDKHKEYTTFDKDNRYRVMVAHPLSGGASINLVAASYCVFFSNGHKVIDRKQCEKRVHRAGQKSERVFYYDLIGNNTIETKMFKNLMNGLDAFDRILNEQDLINIIKGN